MPLAFDVRLSAELFAEVKRRKNQRAAGMLLFAQAEQVRGVTDLCLHLFLAIAEIVVRDDSDDDAGFIATCEFERVPVVVELRLVLPAHAVPSLTVRGSVPMRQAGFFFGSSSEMRREKDAARVTGPMFGVQRGIVLGQIGIAAVAENAFDKIQIAHELARREEADFHSF